MEDAVRPMIDEKLAALDAAGCTGDYEAFLQERIEYWTRTPCRTRMLRVGQRERHGSVSEQ